MYVYTFFIMIVNFVECFADHEKRILSSDPHYTHGLEETLQALTSRIDNLETQHRTDFSLIKASLAQCQMDNTLLSSEYQQLKAQLQGK